MFPLDILDISQIHLITSNCCIWEIQWTIPASLFRCPRAITAFFGPDPVPREVEDTSMIETMTLFVAFGDWLAMVSCKMSWKTKWYIYIWLDLHFWTLQIHIHTYCTPHCTSRFHQRLCPQRLGGRYMEVSWNRGTPKSSMLIGFYILNQPLWGSPFMETPDPLFPRCKGHGHGTSGKLHGASCFFKAVDTAWPRRPERG